MPSGLSNVGHLFYFRCLCCLEARRQCGSMGLFAWRQRRASGLSNVQAAHSTSWAFAALKQDAGSSSHGGSGVPSDLSNVQAIYSTSGAFAALKQDGSVAAWGHYKEEAACRRI